MKASPVKTPKKLIKKKAVVKRPGTATTDLNQTAQSQDYDQFGGSGTPARGALIGGSAARKSKGGDSVVDRSMYE